MKRKIYLTVIWCITLAAMLFGTYKHTSSFFHIFGNSGSSNRGSAAVSADQTELDEFQSIDAEIDAGTITIEEGSQFGISCTGDENLQPEISCSNGVLKLRQNTDFSFNIVSDNSGIVITVPSGTELQDICITADTGNVILSDLTINSLSITTDAGNAELTDLQCSTISMEMDMGDFTAENCTFTELDGQMDMGKAEIKSGQNLDSAEISLSADLGNVRINGQKMGSRYEQDGTSDQSVSVTADMGNISLEW